MHFALPLWLFWVDFCLKTGRMQRFDFFQSIVLKNVEMTPTKIISSLSKLKIHHLFELWKTNAPQFGKQFWKIDFPEKNSTFLKLPEEELSIAAKECRASHFLYFVRRELSSQSRVKYQKFSKFSNCALELQHRKFSQKRG